MPKMEPTLTLQSILEDPSKGSKQNAVTSCEPLLHQNGLLLLLRHQHARRLGGDDRVDEVVVRDDGQAS